MTRLRLIALGTGLLSLSVFSAEMIPGMEPTLPPLFSGIEADSTATLKLLVGIPSGPASTKSDANRIVRKDMVIEKTATDGQGTRKWLLAKLTRYYEACLNIKDRIDLYTPAVEHKTLLTDGEHYGAEWHLTLQTLSSASFQFSDLAKAPEITLMLTGEAQRLYGKTKPLADN